MGMGYWNRGREGPQCLNKGEGAVIGGPSERLKEIS